MALGIGDRLPSFSLEDQNGDLRTPASVQGRWLVPVSYTHLTLPTIVDV